MESLIKVNIAFFSLVAIALAIFSFTMPQAKERIESTGFAIIELYTSEGCSSCPSADKLVSKISEEMKDKEVYVLGFHVDYWNRLGWVDANSNTTFTQRQKEYASRMHLPSIYTPQLVVNGTTEFVGSDETKLRAAIQTGLTTVAIPLSFIVTKVSDLNATIDYSYETSPNTSFVVAVTKNTITTNVKRGENGGRTLTHSHVVNSLQKFPLGKNQTASIELPEGFNFQDWEIIAFVQNTNTGKILSATKAKEIK